MKNSAVPRRAVNAIKPMLWLFCVWSPLLGADFSAAGKPGPYEVEALDGVWIDAARDSRDVPWRAFLPKEAPTPAPIIIHSHGAGGTRDHRAYLGHHLASHGFASFFIQHRGSDEEAIQRLGPQGLLDSIQNLDPSPGILRLQDVPFALDQIERMAGNELRGRIDPARAGMSGHSYGAHTTIIMGGQKSREKGQVFAERRFRAGLAMSTAPRDELSRPLAAPGGSAEWAFDAMLMPIFHLTGTEDDTMIATADERQHPYRWTSSVDQYLLVLDKGVHLTFHGERVDYPELDHHLELTKMAATVFWHAYLREDAEALKWLQDGGYLGAVGGAGRFEFKPER